MNQPYYEKVKISDLSLDEENPRFASSLLVHESSGIRQQMIIKHLLRYADIVKLANRINEVKGLHPSELLTCWKSPNGYVVLEGNRRLCACKLLLDRSLIPEEYQRVFPFIKDNVEENISEVMATIYPDRESVQSYLSDRHISGIKKWSALEKNNYYMNLFSISKDLKEIKAQTSDSEAVIKNSITKYQFFWFVYKVLKTKYIDLEIEKIDYLPMVDRFMGILVGDDPEVGLNLNFDNDSLYYFPDEDKKEIFNKILLLVGEAFLIRKKRTIKSTEEELGKILSTEIPNKEKQKALIIENSRIPGLLELIQLYQKGDGSKGDGSKGDGSKGDGSKGDGSKGDGSKGDGSKGDGSNLQDPYIPEQKRYTNSKLKDRRFLFSTKDSEGWSISTNQKYADKIYELLRELGTVNPLRYLNAYAFLYRCLLEIATKYAYEKYKTNEYDEANLAGNIKKITNQFLYRNDSQKYAEKKRRAINKNISTDGILDVLNLYIHYPEEVDFNILESSWTTMKDYIHRCLSS